MKESAANLLFSVVLAESVYGPDGCGYPTEKGDLEDKTDHTGEGAADGEEGKPGKQKCDDESHGGAFFLRNVFCC